MLLLRSFLLLSLFGTSVASAGVTQQANYRQVEDSKLETIFTELGKILEDHQGKLAKHVAEMLEVLKPQLGPAFSNNQRDFQQPMRRPRQQSSMMSPNPRKLRSSPYHGVGGATLNKCEDGGDSRCLFYEDSFDEEDMIPLDEEENGDWVFRRTNLPLNSMKMVREDDDDRRGGDFFERGGGYPAERGRDNYDSMYGGDDGGGGRKNERFNNQRDWKGDRRSFDFDEKKGNMKSVDPSGRSKNGSGGQKK